MSAGSHEELRELVRQIALCPDSAARSAWQRLPPYLDLDRLADDDGELLPSLGARAKELGFAHPSAPTLIGIWRHTWLNNQIALEQLLSSLRGPEPLLRGRPATLVAFARSSGDLSFRPPLTSRIWARPPSDAMLAEFHGDSVSVPMPADHALQMLWYREESDAALAIQHPAMDWERFSAQASTLGLRSGVAPGLSRLAELLGPSVVPRSVLEDLVTGRVGRATDIARRGLRMLGSPIK